MGCFIQGVAGGIAILVVAAIIVPQYADYAASAEVSRWCWELQPTRQTIRRKIEQLKATHGVGDGIPVPTLSDASLVEITHDGTIIVQGGRLHQLLLLTPRLTPDGVEWRTLVGPEKAAKGCQLH